MLSIVSVLLETENHTSPSVKGSVVLCCISLSKHWSTVSPSPLPRRRRYSSSHWVHRLLWFMTECHTIIRWQRLGQQAWQNRQRNILQFPYPKASCSFSRTRIVRYLWKGFAMVSLWESNKLFGTAKLIWQQIHGIFHMTIRKRYIRESTAKPLFSCAVHTPLLYKEGYCRDLLLSNLFT